MDRYISNVPMSMQTQQYQTLQLLWQCFFFSPVLTMTHRQNGVLSEPPAKAQTQDHILHLANFNDSEENSQKVFFCLGIFLFRKFIDPAPF